MRQIMETELSKRSSLLKKMKSEQSSSPARSSDNQQVPKPKPKVRPKRKLIEKLKRTAVDNEREHGTNERCVSGTEALLNKDAATAAQLEAARADALRTALQSTWRTSSKKVESASSSKSSSLN